MSSTAMVKCKCKHSAQDKMYGLGVRVANALAKKEKTSNAAYRCTVCSAIHNTTPAKAEVKEKE